MPAIDQIDVQPVLHVTDDATAVKEVVASLFWQWFHDHQDNKVTTVHIWFFSKTLYIRDLHEIFILLFGPEQ